MMVVVLVPTKWVMIVVVSQTKGVVEVVCCFIKRSGGSGDVSNKMCEGSCVSARASPEQTMAVVCSFTGGVTVVVFVSNNRNECKGVVFRQNE